MAETMGNKDVSIERENKTKSNVSEIGRIKPSTAVLNTLKMEPLEKSIETFESYGLSEFYTKLNPEQQKAFLETLSKAGITEVNLQQKIHGVNGIAFSVGNDTYSFSFPDIGLPATIGNQSKYDNYTSLMESISEKDQNIKKEGLPDFNQFENEITFSLRTPNDNLSKNGYDDGNTFGLGGRIDYGNKYTDINLDSYTKNPNYIYKNGRIGKWNLKEAGSRIDELNIEVGEKYILSAEQTKITTNIGIGAELRGNFGGENIQNKWHDVSKTAAYHVEAPYDTSENGIFLKGGIVAEKAINKNISFGGEAELKLGNLTQSVDGKVYTNLRVGPLDLHAGIGVSTANVNSPTIEYGTPKGIYGEVNAELHITDTVSTFVAYKEYEGNKDKGSNGQGAVGLNFKF